MFEISPLLISGGCNSVYHGLDWLAAPSLIAYPCANQVLIYDPKLAKVAFSYSFSQSKLNSVRFLADCKEKASIFLIFGYSDGSLAILNNTNIFEKVNNWKLVQVKTKDEASIHKITVFKDYMNNIFAVNRTDGSVEIYNINTNINNNEYEINELTKLNFGVKVQESCEFVAFDEHNVFLFLGGLDYKMHIYSFDENLCLTYLTTVKGHDNALTDIKAAKMVDHFLVASSSKDSTIRLYSLKVLKEELKESQDEAYQNRNSQAFYNKQQLFEISLESILNLHTEPVSSLSWSPDAQKLLSSSFDYSLLLWTKDEKSGVWVNEARLGQMAGTKNAFFHSTFSPCGSYILAYTYHGSFYLWQHDKNNDWCDRFFASGHFGPIKDLDWNSSYDYLVTGGSDQTTRIWGEWKKKEGSTWHEISRAQIHGYDINSIKNLKMKNSNNNKVIDLIICGADEKILRVFEPTAIFANFLNTLSQNNLHLYFPSQNDEDQVLLKKDPLLYRTTTEGGSQVLGLMTKAIKVEKQKYTSYYDDEEGGIIDENEEKEGGKNSIDFSTPPNEEFLTKHTLWPEINKLYGHGFELQAIATNSDGSLIFSSCKSQTSKDAEIIIWDVEKYKIQQKLEGHSFTISCLEFDEKNGILASAGRDRLLCLWRKGEEGWKGFWKEKGHMRMVLGLGWSHDGEVLGSGSRDKRIKLWSAKKDEPCLIGDYVCGEPVMAIAFADKPLNNNQYLIAVGLESGKIILLAFDGNAQDKKINLIQEIPADIGHNLAVTRIKFRKVKEEGVYQFASTSFDHSVRILKLKLI